MNNDILSYPMYSEELDIFNRLDPKSADILIE